MKRLVIVTLSLVVASCGDNLPAGTVDANPDSTTDSSIDAPDVDAMVDAMPTPAQAIDAVKAAADETPISLPVFDATVTYLKPMIAGATVANDPPGFTVQVGASGPALFVAVDPATLTTLAPALAVGDVVDFTVTEKDTSGQSPRATAITSISRSATATDIAPLVQDVTAVANLASMIADFDSELVDVTAATIEETWGTSGAAFSRTRITTTGVPAIDPNLQLRIPTTFRDALVASADLEIGCVVAIHRTPVNRFAAQFQVSAFTPSDITITSCPAPTVASAIATDATHVTVTFSRNIDMATVMANGSQFTIADGANPLAVSAAAVVDPRTISLTTANQIPSTSYTVTVANTVEDVVGGAVGTPNTATFTGFTIPIPTVMMATAPNATTVDVTFTRDIDMATVMANGSQFTIVDDATPTPNTLAVSAASVSGMVVTLTTDAQTPGAMYTVTVATSVEDTDGTPVAAPLSATFLGFTPTVGASHLVINEIDYDMSGTDSNEYIEILNPTNAAISLVGMRIVLINGNATDAPVAYTSIDLDSVGTLDAGEYLVIGSATLLPAVPATEKTLAFAGATNQIQNGPRDGVALIDLAGPALIDVIFYNGNTNTNLVYDAAGQNLTIVPEGVASSAIDPDNSTMGAVCRHPNGTDTDNNADDIELCTMQTPGAANTL